MAAHPSRRCGVKRAEPAARMRHAGRRGEPVVRHGSGGACQRTIHRCVAAMVGTNRVGTVELPVGGRSRCNAGGNGPPQGMARRPVAARGRLVRQLRSVRGCRLLLSVDDEFEEFELDEFDIPLELVAFVVLELVEPLLDVLLG